MKRVLFLLIVLCTTPLGAVDIWNVEMVEDGWSVGHYTSLAILPSAQPAISYYDYINGDLEYAWFEEGEWHKTTVDNDGNVGSHTSLAILPSGQPAISYLDRTNDNLKYAWFDGVEWKTLCVDPAASVGYTSLAVSPSGHPAISYSGTDTIRYAWFDGINWQIIVVDSVGTNGGQTSLVFSPYGRPMISYYDGINRNLKFAEPVGRDWYDLNRWIKTVVDNTWNVGVYNSLAILPSGRPVIAYSDNRRITQDLRFARLEDGRWHTSVASSTGNMGRYCSLAILLENGPTANCYGGLEQISLSSQPVISCYGGWYLQFSWFDGIRWQTTRITGHTMGLYSSIKILPCGQPAISYHRTDGSLRYAWFEGFAWYNVIVDSGHQRGTYTSLAISPLSGLPSISFYDITNRDLCYAWFDDNDGWQSMPVDTENVGTYTSLAFLPSGQSAISYHAMVGDALRYAEFDGNEWHITIVDDAPVTGNYSSLAISPVTGQPCISYTSNDDLRYTWFDGSTWHVGTVVDGEGDVGYHTSLTFLPSGRPAISYYNDTDGNLKYAEFIGEDPSNPDHWQTIIVDSEDDVGEYTSIEIWNGQPAISYYDVTNKNLKFAWRVRDTWQTTTIDDGLNTGTYSSLEIVSGKPTISYHSDGDLKCAELVSTNLADRTAWKITITDTGGGTYTSLSVLPTGQAAISYYHAGSGDLKYAVGFSQ